MNTKKSHALSMNLVAQLKAILERPKLDLYDMHEFIDDLDFLGQTYDTPSNAEARNLMKDYIRTRDLKLVQSLRDSVFALGQEVYLIITPRSTPV